MFMITILFGMDEQYVMRNSIESTANTTMIYVTRRVIDLI